MRATQVQPHMPLGMRDRSMRALWAPGLPWLSGWHKTRGLSPLMCAMLTPGNSTVACATLQEGFVAPIRVALSTRVSPHDQHVLTVQMDTIREYATWRDWTVTDFVRHCSRRSFSREQHP
jgi:hypothetical protein